MLVTFDTSIHSQESNSFLSSPQTSEVERRQKERQVRVKAAEADIAAKLAAVDTTFDLKEKDLQEKFDKLEQEALRHS